MESFDLNILNIYKLRRDRGYTDVFESMFEYLMGSSIIGIGPRGRFTADKIRRDVEGFIEKHQLASSYLEVMTIIYGVRIELFEAPGVLKEVLSPFKGAIRDTVRIAFVDGRYYLLSYANSPSPPEQQLSVMLYRLRL